MFIPRAYSPAFPARPQPPFKSKLWLALAPLCLVVLTVLGFLVYQLGEKTEHTFNPHLEITSSSQNGSELSMDLHYTVSGVVARDYKLMVGYTALSSKEGTITGYYFSTDQPLDLVNGNHTATIPLVPVSSPINTGYMEFFAVPADKADQILNRHDNALASERLTYAEVTELPNALTSKTYVSDCDAPGVTACFR